MPFTAFAKRPLATCVAAVLLLHLLVLWAVRAGLLESVQGALPPVVQLTFITPTATPRLAPPAPPVRKPEPVPPKAVAERAQPAPPVPAPRSAEAIAPSQPVASALPAAPQGQAAPAVPAGAALGLAQVPGGVGPAAATAAAPAPAPPAQPKVELPAVDAEYLHAPKLEYPRMSRKLNEQGRVLVAVLIGTDGMPQKLEVKTSSGYERLDQAALATVKGWHFVPGKRGGVPEAMWFTVPIHFVLNE